MEHDLERYYQNEKAPAAFALMKVELSQKIAFAVAETGLRIEKQSIVLMVVSNPSHYLNISLDLASSA